MFGDAHEAADHARALLEGWGAIARLEASLDEISGTTLPQKRASSTARADNLGQGAGAAERLDRNRPTQAITLNTSATLSPEGRLSGAVKYQRAGARAIR